MIEVAAATTDGEAPGPRRAFSIRRLARSLLIAVSVVTLLPGAFAVVGGYFPRLPVVGPFGTILNTGFPWILLDLALATALALAAAALGAAEHGRRPWGAVAVPAAVLAVGLFIGFRYVTFAADHGAGYDVVRASNGFPPLAEPDTRLVFERVEGIDLRAEIWLPDGATEAGAGTLPAVVFVHGGAFQAGFPGTRPLLMEAVDRAGIVAIDIDYRLAPPPRWDQAPADVLCALAWVRTAGELAMVDRQRVVVVGESAGGSLALVAGYAAGTGAIASSCPERGEPVVPAGVVAIAPAADLRGIWQDATLTDFGGSRFPELYVGGSPVEFPERYDAAEPFRLLRPELPRTLIIAGEIDRLVHIERQIETAARIRAAGADVELLVAPFAGHGFDGEPNSFGAQLVERLVPEFVERGT